MVVAGLCFTILAICLIFKLNYNSIIPFIPYWCGVSLALSLIAIAFLSIIGSIWFYTYIKQLTRVYIRFNHNSMASADGKPILPSISIYPQLSLKKKRILRKCVIISLTAFALCFVVTMITAMLSAKAFEFWHIWGWFGYTPIN